MGINNYMTDSWIVNKLNYTPPIAKDLYDSEQYSRMDMFSKRIGIASKEMIESMIRYAKDCEKIMVPGSCNRCKQERPIVVKTMDYLEAIVKRSSKGWFESIEGFCSRCKKIGSGKLMKIDW